MRTFKDAKDRTWEVVIDPVTVKRVKNILKENLYALIENEGKPLGELFQDPVRLVDILYVLCTDECKAKNISDEDFGRGFNGDALEAASEAFLEELIDFFPPRIRTNLRMITQKGKVFGVALAKRGLLKLEAFDPEQEADKLMAKLEEQISKSSSGNSSASLVVAHDAPSEN